MRVAPPVPPASPTSVRFSSALLFGVAGLWLLSAVAELTFVNTGLSVYRDAYTGGTGSAAGSIVRATLDIFLAGGAALLAVLNGQGRRKARITTYVLGGIFLLCGGPAAVVDPVHRPAGSAGDSLADRIVPTLYGVGTGLAGLLIVMAALTALVLLALPASNHFFEVCERNRYLLVVTPPPYAGPDSTPPLYAGPGGTPFAVPQQREPEPHTGSIPATDPWAEPPG